jgi:hypothetical protein
VCRWKADGKNQKHKALSKDVCCHSAQVIEVWNRAQALLYSVQVNEHIPGHCAKHEEHQERYVRLQGSQAEVVSEYTQDFEQHQQQGVATCPEDDTEQSLGTSVRKLDELQAVFR